MNSTKPEKGTAREKGVGSGLLLVLLLTFGVREAKKRVECKLEEELVDRIDRVAKLLKTNRTDIIRSACIAYLKTIEIGANKGARAS